MSAAVTPAISRRALVGGLATGARLMLSGCDRLGNDPRLRRLLRSGEEGNYALQRLLQDRTGLAEEFAPAQRSPVFLANGTRMPGGGDYGRHMATQFADWQLVVDGAVTRPQACGLASCARCPLAARSRATIASRGGARSRNGRVRC